MSDSIIAGAPKDAKTGEIIKNAQESGLAEELPSIGSPTPVKKGKKTKSDDSQTEEAAEKGKAEASATPPATPEPAPARPADKKTEFPTHLYCLIDEKAPDEGSAPVFTGAPGEIPVPGTLVHLWIRSHVKGWMAAYVMVVCQSGPSPMLKGEGPGFEGCTLRPTTMGHFKTAPVRFSPIPKLDYFTPIRKWRPEMLRIPGE